MPSTINSEFPMPLAIEVKLSLLLSVFTKADATASFSRLRDQGSVSFSITFAPERKSSAKHVRTSANEYSLLASATKWSDDIPTSEVNVIKSKFAPAEDNMNEHMPTLSIHSLCPK